MGEMAIDFSKLNAPRGMTKVNDFESWKSAECPEGMDEATFNHVWFGYGIKHNYLIFDTKSKSICIKQDGKLS